MEVEEKEQDLLLLVLEAILAIFSRCFSDLVPITTSISNKDPLNKETVDKKIPSIHFSKNIVLVAVDKALTFSIN